MSVVLEKKNACLVARIVSFDTAGLHLSTIRILESNPFKDIGLILVTLSRINNIIIVPSNYVLFEPMLPSFPAAKI